MFDNLIWTKLQTVEVHPFENSTFSYLIYLFNLFPYKTKLSGLIAIQILNVIYCALTLKHNQELYRPSTSPSTQAKT